jgi:hypothetical protein
VSASSLIEDELSADLWEGHVFGRSTRKVHFLLGSVHYDIFFDTNLRNNATITFASQETLGIPT